MSKEKDYSDLCGESWGAGEVQRDAEVALRLIERASLAPPKLAWMIRSSGQTYRDKLDRALQLLPHLTEFLDDAEPPDPDWWRDYFLVTGKHAILSEEGWEPGENKASYLADDPKWKPMDEVNAPA